MKTIYETFEEIVDAFVDGYSWTHSLSEHTADECIGWQHGAMEFAKFLDSAGVSVSCNEGQLFKEIRTFTPVNRNKYLDHVVKLKNEIKLLKKPKND